LAIAGCSDKPKPQPPPPPPEEPPPPPPPPKCESLDEKCRAKASTVERIGDSGYTFTPPQGWLYAQEEQGTVTIPDQDAGPLLVFEVHEFDKNSLKRQREYVDKMAALCERFGIKVNKPGVVLMKPVRDKIDDLAFEMWDVYNSKGMTGARKDATGAVLIIAAPIESRHLFGVAFADRDDEASTEFINKSIQTLAKAGSEKTEKDAAEDPASGDGAKK